YDLALTTKTDDIQLEIVFGIPLEELESTNLTDPSTVAELTNTVEPPLTKHFQTEMGDNFLGLTIKGFSRGSLKVDVIVSKKTTEQGAADFVDAALSVTDVTVIINNETYGASVSSIENLKVDQDTMDGSDSLCQLFLAANGHCPPQTECTVINSKPICQDSDSTEYNWRNIPTMN
ncbi:hypothetical protein MAR_034037, partial [Mya arenaria]